MLLSGQFFSTSRIFPLHDQIKHHMNLNRQWHSEDKKKSIKKNLLLLQTDIKTLRTTKNGSILLAGFAYSWCVDDRK